ncbi:hypothetical protein FIU97_01350 [Roseivivax sp. THAF40]|uniref:hypothetical protein n=1 Tax=Roseivivax sp. THAF40 TaxID=2587858 RepID=UPI00126874ED|nr:hypothetical protein [Roseivivax sp. THAF40]QFT45208.1 hypothetical protein FIU97_01350 [Roseivivax sp. THAF40]
MSSGSASKQVFFHVGLPKTGTKTFQAMLQENKHALDAADLGVILKGPSTKAFSRVARSLREGDGFAPWLRYKLRRAAQDLETAVRQIPQGKVIVSYENLLGWRIENLYRHPYDRGTRFAVDTLTKAFHAHDVAWIVTTRNAEAHYQSAYSFKKKQRGEASSFDEWSKRVGRYENLDTLIADAKAHWGARGHVFSMEAEIEKGGLWGRNILEVVGLDDLTISNLKPADRANVGLPKPIVPFVDLLNRLDLKKSDRKAITGMFLEIWDATDRGETK